MVTDIFDIIDDKTGAVIGQAPRSQCHGNPSLLHRTTHIFVLHPDGRILLQKRRDDKDTQPGKWDTAVGGHLDSGEDWEQAAHRELAEELGIPNADQLQLKFLFDLKLRNQIESENTRVFALTSEGPFHFLESEIAEIRWWTKQELQQEFAEGCPHCTPILTMELQRLLGEDRELLNI